MTPVTYTDLPDLVAIKSDPRIFAIMLGGVRTKVRAAEELADDIVLWGEHGFGIWAVRDVNNHAFLGLTGFMNRPDGRGVALRFAFWPEANGRGVGREASAAALRFGHERAGLERVIAVARESNFASRTLLAGIGFRPVEGFQQGGHSMLLFESRRYVAHTWAWGRLDRPRISGGGLTKA